jgi:hypothetical protein
MKTSKASPKMTKLKNSGTRVKKSSGCVGSAIARARERRKGH